MAATRSTPGRRRHNNQKENIYFEPGKQGRRTGITLKDTGVRDEYGLEPVSGIFSSPVPSPHPEAESTIHGNTTLHSEDMVLAESPPPDITEALNLRKTPRLPPKTQTPRHTNIGGSPVRHSSVRPESRHTSPQRPLSTQPDRANRKLDFSQKQNPVSPSPFKPRRTTRKSIFNFDDSPVKRLDRARSDSAELERTVQEAQDAVHQMVGDAFDAGAPPEDEHPTSLQTDQTDDDTAMTHVQPAEKQSAREGVTTLLSSAQSSNQKRKREQVKEQDNITEESPSTTRQQSASKRRKARLPLEPAEPAAVDETHAETTVNEPEDTEYTIAGPARIDQTVMDQTEYTAADPAEYTDADQTELAAADRTVYTVADPTEYTTADPTEYTTVDRTEYTTADHTEYTVADQTEYTVADPTQYTVADPTEYTQESIEGSILPDETVVGAENAPHSAQKKTAQIREDITDGEMHSEDDVSEPEEYVPPPEVDYDQEATQAKKRGRGRPKGRKSATSQPAPRKAPAQPRPKPDRDTNSADSETSRKPGPRSIVALRAGTPQEDEGATQTRSGRTSIKPLKYWCNESFIWRNGEVNGIVRAEELNTSKPVSRARGKPKKKTNALGAIREDEEDEDEDLLPEAWEDELGVINGRVRTWDAETGVGNPDDEIHEDIAFASTSIATRDVQGSAFRYAKVMTMPFFGSGMVEVPPEGYKRMKNSRKMQMCFFVHEGKVTVEVGDIKFGMSKGGVWQVPRGNNYAILNESKRHTAKLFFAQGCEVEKGVDEAGPA